MQRAVLKQQAKSGGLEAKTGKKMWTGCSTPLGSGSNGKEAQVKNWSREAFFGT